MEAYGHLKENVLDNRKIPHPNISIALRWKAAEGDIICLLDKRLSSPTIDDQGGTSRVISSSALASHVTELTVKLDEVNTFILGKAGT